MIPIKQSTAGQIIELGPFLDSIDGNTEEIALTIANTDILIHKYGAIATVAKNSGGATHMANGRYYITLDATDTNTLGSMKIGCHIAGALYVWVDCMVMTPAAYDIATGTTALGSADDLWSNPTRTLTAGTKDTEIDAIKAVTEVIPDLGAMTSIAKEASLFDPSSDVVANVTLVDTVTTNTDMRGTDSALTDKADFSLSAAGIDSILDEAIGDGAITMRETLRGLISHIAGKASGGGTTTLTWRNISDTKDVIIKTVDTNGNRSSVTLDL